MDSVEIKREVIDSILTHARMCHPKEGILLLKGKKRKNRLVVEEVLLPPLATHGSGFSSFPLNMLPMDFSIIGTAHSHPSGVLLPSLADLNYFYGKIMVISVYPYASELNIAIFDPDGSRIEYSIIE